MIAISGLTAGCADGILGFPDQVLRTLRDVTSAVRHRILYPVDSLVNPFGPKVWVAVLDIN